MLTKHIVLSEKVEFLSLFGTFDQKMLDNSLIKVFIPNNKHKSYFGGSDIIHGKNMRFLNFINSIIKQYGLYQYMQKYIERPIEFKSLYL